MSEFDAKRVAHPDDEVLTDLALQLLPPERAQETLGHLRTCGSCERRFRSLAGDWETASSRSARMCSAESPATDATRARRESVGSRGILDRLRDVLGSPSWGWAAVPVAVAALALLVLLPRSPDDVFVGRLPQPTGEVLRRSHLPPADRESLRGGLDAYARGEWGTAIRSLREVEADGALESLRRIYLGNALAHEGRHGEVVTVLESVPFSEIPEPWSGEGRWALYVALDRTGQEARAQELLELLRNVPGEVGNRARSISEKEASP